MIDEKVFCGQTVKNDSIQIIATGQEDDFTTVVLLVFTLFQNILQDDSNSFKLLTSTWSWSESYTAN